MSSFSEFLNQLTEKTLSGKAVSREEAAQLYDTTGDDLMLLAGGADRIRIKFKGATFDACSLINARSGRCSEDCAFCAQSGHHSGDCDEYELKGADEILAAANNAKSFGATRFCTVTSGGALSEAEFDSLLNSLKLVSSQVDILLDASLGFLDDSRAERLKVAGITRYNHNLETSPDYYSEICTTHRFDQRVETVQMVLNHGFSACSGGIIGMGETRRQRLDLAFTIRDLGIDCVPINILNPRPGTPLENAEQLSPMEIIRTIAIFRFVLPTATIKIAGGRERNLGDFQGLALRSGANGMIIGGYLTTSGRVPDDDLKMVRDAGFII